MDYDHAYLVKQARKAPYLQKDEEHRLAVQWSEKQDQKSLNLLTSAHLRLVISMAHKFKAYGLPMSDLIQGGYTGVMEAAHRFDPHRDIRFSTYATWWIRASMQVYVLRNWSIVRGGTSSKTEKAVLSVATCESEIGTGKWRRVRIKFRRPRTSTGCDQTGCGCYGRKYEL